MKPEYSYTGYRCHSDQCDDLSHGFALLPIKGQTTPESCRSQNLEIPEQDERRIPPGSTARYNTARQTEKIGLVSKQENNHNRAGIRATHPLRGRTQLSRSGRLPGGRRAHVAPAHVVSKRRDAEHDGTRPAEGTKRAGHQDRCRPPRPGLDFTGRHRTSCRPSSEPPPFTLSYTGSLNKGVSLVYFQHGRVLRKCN